MAHAKVKIWETVSLSRKLHMHLLRLTKCPGLTGQRPKS